MKRIKNNMHGFTWIEIIIVIAIFASFAGIIIPEYIQYNKNSPNQQDVIQYEGTN